MRSSPLSIAYIVRDPLPPRRADVLTLFGDELPRHGVHAELVGQAGPDAADGPDGSDGTGSTGQPDRGGMQVVGRLGSRFAAVCSPFWDVLGLLRAWRRVRPGCVQVRDKIASAFMAWLAARLLGVPFVYWMSFPIVEGFEVRRDAIGKRGRGALWLAHALRAQASRLLLYRLVLPRADHVFVQSEAMRAWLAGSGIAPGRMTAVPMGVDSAVFARSAIVPSTDPRLDGRRVVVYLGSVAQSRQSGFLLDVALLLRARLPEVLLVIAGDAPSLDEMAWMRREIASLKLGEHVLLTGWLPQREALGYAVRAEVGLSPIPRGVLFDVSSPTKLVEYLALGIPSVANDIPDQALVLEESGAGLCVPMQAGAFAEATLRLLDDRALAAALAARGPPWVDAHRSYAILGRKVAQAYSAICPPCGPTR
ncbi:glycosyltransferase [Massilia sp. IC2-278]|uniref:glycosyltransferase n=1 Tax=Massilia sp. IC2-278 TaxID=2887200 RepID=UPI001E47A46D|nr:glycosyltransferase [Massilia sp. IC2-278]MCC2962423.1 glycosyltransferase [Massilia sp. IC2-278]